MFQNVLLTKVVLFDTIDTRQSVFKHTFKTQKWAKPIPQSFLKIKLFSK